MQRLCRFLSRNQLNWHIVIRKHAWQRWRHFWNFCWWHCWTNHARKFIDQWNIERKLINRSDICILINWRSSLMLQNKWLIRCRFFEIWRHIDMKIRKFRIWKFRIWRKWSLKHWNFSIYTFVWLCFKFFWLCDNVQCHDINRFSHKFVKQFECDRHFFIKFYMFQKIFHLQRKQLIVAKWVR